MGFEDNLVCAIVSVTVGFIIGFLVACFTDGRRTADELIKSGLAHYEVNPTTGQTKLKYQCSGCGLTKSK